MTPFKRGDIVVYAHPNAPAENRGSLAIVTSTRENLVNVQWLSINRWLQEIFENTEQGEDFWETNWESVSFEKVGHLDGI